MTYHVYMTASRRHGTLYLGVTNNLSRRVWEHKTEVYPGFSKKCGVNRLAWYEVYECIDEAQDLHVLLNRQCSWVPGSALRAAPE